MDISGIIIRDASEGDIDALARLESEMFSTPWSVNNLRKDLNASFSVFVVAEREGSIIGYASAWNVAGEIQLNRIAVTGDFRRSGIGTKLMNGIIDRLKRWKPRKVLLEVRERNTAAREFYKSVGFYETGRRNNYYHDDNAILLDLDLIGEER